MPKITEMFAFVTTVKDEQDEGIMGAFSVGKGIQPLIGADMDRVKSLIPVADSIKAITGKSYKILKFKIVEEIKPESIN